MSGPDTKVAFWEMPQKAPIEALRVYSSRVKEMHKKLLTKAVAYDFMLAPHCKRLHWRRVLRARKPTRSQGS